MIDNDRAPAIAWSIFRTLIYLARFWIGAICLLAAVGAIISIFGSYNPALAVWHAFILMVLALFIWPPRYNPPLRYALRSARRGITRLRT